MKKGVIMNVDGRFLTLLTPDGEFLRANKQKEQEYLIGEEMEFVPINQVQKKKSLVFDFIPRKALIAAAFAIIVAVASFIPYYNNNAVYAYMSIDVNPSIELAINHHLEVVDIEAYNSDGEQIISELQDWKHKEVSVVTTTVLEEIKEQGFFQDHDNVVISTVYVDKLGSGNTKKLESNIKQMEVEFKKENIQVSVVQGTKEDREAAQKQGISTGVFIEKQPNTDKVNVKKPVNQKENNPSKDKIKDTEQNNHKLKDNKQKEKELEKNKPKESKNDKKQSHVNKFEEQQEKEKNKDKSSKMKEKKKDMEQEGEKTLKNKPSYDNRKNVNNIHGHIYDKEDKESKPNKKKDNE